MDLYISPMSCSFAAHLACLEAGITPTLHRVDRATKLLDDGSDYRAIAPLAIVPVIRDDGFVLGESSAVLQYIADHAPDHRLAPAAGTRERYLHQQWLNFITSELHKGYSPLFRNPPEEWKAKIKETLAARLDFTARALEARPFLLGEFSVADAYLFTVLRWSKDVGIDLGPWPALLKYFDRVAARPAVKTALEVEGVTV